MDVMGELERELAAAYDIARGRRLGMLFKSGVNVP
jgi:hypothetical protein